MSLIDLSRSTSRADPICDKTISADDFILQAISYANGASEIAITNNLTFNTLKHPPMRRATFTLSEECIAMLTKLSSQSGIAKSKLIRLWIMQFAQIDNA